MKYSLISFLLVFFFYTSFGGEVIHNILDYGAKRGYGTDNTESIQKAIDACSTQGGKVYFPEGIFMSGTVFLKSNVTIEISENSTWQAYPDQNAFPFIEQSVITRLGPEPRKALIYAENVVNVTLQGKGLFYPYGDHEVFQTGKGDDPYRPYGIFMIACKNIEIKDLTMKHSAYWMQRYLECNNLRISNITVFNHSNLNNDGCDIDGCKDVVVTGCIIDSSDDALCFKSESNSVCENVTVSNCILRSHASALKWGTGSVGGFRNFTINNCIISTSQAKIMHHPMDSWIGLVGIDMGNVDGGIMENIIINGVTIDGIETPIFIRLGNRNGNQWARNDKFEQGITRNIRIQNITGTSGGKIPCAITAYPGNCIEDISLSDIRLSFAGGANDYDFEKEIPELSSAYPINRMFGDDLPAYGFYIRHVKNIQLENINLSLQNPDIRPAIYTENVDGLKVDNYYFSNVLSEAPPVYVRNSQNFSFTGEGIRDSVANFIQVTGTSSQNFQFYNSKFQDELEHEFLSGISARAKCDKISFIEITWNSYYNDGGTGYFKIFRENELLARTRTKKYIDNKVVSGKEYQYLVQYFDNTDKKREELIAQITAVEDTDKPFVNNFRIVDNQTLEFVFSEPLSKLSQAQEINFKSTPELKISNLIWNEKGRKLTLSVDPIDPKTNYKLELSGLTDASSEKNRMEKFKTGFVDKPLAFQLDFNSSRVPEKNNVSILEKGVSGTAAYFDGMDDYIYIPSNEDTNYLGNMAVSLWFKIENPESDEYMRLLSNRKTWNENAGYELEINPLRNRINFCGGAINTDEQGVTEYSFDNDWHHLVAMIKDNKAVFYVNGELIGKDSFVAEPLPTKTGLYIGCSGSETDFFHGWLDEIKLFRRALSEKEIVELFNIKMNEN